MVQCTPTRDKSRQPMDGRCSLDLQPTMRSSRFITFTACALLEGAGFVFGQGAPPRAGSLGNEKAPAGPTPRTPEGKVDFSGVWDPGFSFANLGQVPLQIGRASCRGRGE